MRDMGLRRRVVAAIMVALGWAGVCVMAEPIPPAPLTPDDQTALLLHLDGDPVDASRRALAVSVKGNASWAEGRFGQAVVLDGAAGLTAVHSRWLSPRDQDWMVECFFRIDQAQPGSVTLISMGYGFGRMIDLAVADGGKRLAFTAAAGNHDASVVRSHELAILDGAWHHAAGVIDRSRNGELRVYVDGVDVTERVSYQHRPIDTEDGRMIATIGAITPWNIATKGFKGAIDEVRISSVLRDGYRAPADAPAPAEAPAEAIPAEASVSPDDPASLAPVTLSPQNTVLVLPRLAGTSEHEAATLLATYLKQAFGANEGFELRSEPAPGDLTGKIVLAVGDTGWTNDDELAELPPDGFRVRRKANVVTLAGRTPRASYYAATYFLEQFCGVRFYMPGELFTHVPASPPVITLEKVDRLQVPYVHTASSSGYHNLKAENDWLRRRALDRRQDTHQHSMWYRFPPEKYAERYAEIYPILEGKRYIPTSSQDQKWQPTFSEPKLVDAAVESATEYFRENPGFEFVAFSVQDSHIHSELDLASDEVKQHGKVRGLSNLYWRFLNNVAQRLESTHPDKKVVGLAYASVRLAPSFKLHPNVVVWIQYTHADIAIDQVWNEAREDGEDRMSVIAWTKTASQFGHHDWAMGNGYLIPRIYTASIQKSFLEHDRRGAPLRYTHAEGYPNWGLDGPKLYLMSRIWWDPTVDVDAELRRFCDDLFAGGAGAMHDYFVELESLYAKMNAVKERKLHRWFDQLQVNDEQRASLRRCRELLDTAASQAAGDELARRRIELFSKTLRLSEMVIDLANAPAFDASRADEIRRYVAGTIAPDPLTIYRRSFENDDLSKSIDGVLKAVEVGLKKKAK